MWPIIITAWSMLGLWALCRFIVVPFARMEYERRVSRRHNPQPEEIWDCDGEMYYIDSVGPTGVEIMTFNPQTPGVNRWKDDWNTWQWRLKNQNLRFTGQRRPLGNA
jgi:hypothetical protein